MYGAFCGSTEHSGTDIFLEIDEDVSLRENVSVISMASFCN